VTATDGLPELLEELGRQGVKLRLGDAGQLEVIAPRGQVPEDLRARLREAKPALVAWLTQMAQAPAGEPGGLPQIVPDPEGRSRPFPLSDLQMSFYIGSREGFEYHVRPHQYMEFDFAELDAARYEQALNDVVARQRGNLVVVREDMQLEVVSDPGPVRIPVSDLRGMPEAEAERQMEQTRAAMERRELPLDRWPWMDIHISLYGDGRGRVHYNNNNFFSDAFASSRLIETVRRRYENPDEPLPELSLSYRDCVLALAELEESPSGQAAKKYWNDRMEDWPGSPALPMAAGVDTRRRSKLHRRELVIPPEAWAAVKGRGTALGLSPTAVFYGVHSELLSYWSGTRHFLINNMITHRQPLHPEIDDVVGNFASLYPLEIDWRHTERFQDRVRRLQAQNMADMEQVHWSGVKVLQTLNQVRGTPGLAACPVAIGSALFVGQADRPYYSTLETPQVAFDCEIWELRDGSLWVVWDIIEEVFPAGLIDDMESGCLEMFARLAEDDIAWEQPGFELLPPAQRHQRARLNRPAGPAPFRLLHAALPRQAAALAAKPAVVGAAGALTYRELDDRSRVLAQRLQRIGVGRGALVAVALPKCPEQIVAVFGALAAGAAYVPVDPSWPDDRIRYVLADTGAAAVLADAQLRDRITAIADVTVLAVDAPNAEEASGVVAPSGAEPGDMAYVIYTSGSTGRPKGAMLDHRGPLNTIIDVNDRFGISARDVLFGVSSLCFDLSVYDVFGAVAAGATLVLPDPERNDPTSWLELARTREVTVWNSVPAIMQLLVEEAAAKGVQLPALRVVLLSGDWIPVDLPGKIREIAPNARVVSLGGATEASIWSICFPIDRQDPAWTSIPYGKPLANQSWHVLDELGRDVPTWVTGELHIGGAGVALGYLNDPVKTKGAFVTHLRTGERLYRTGDLGRYLPSGDIEFLGRADFQVKIQGFRVELGEIEQALLEHPSVQQATVVARAAGSGKQLAAFVVGERGTAPDAQELAGFVGQRLPSYMVPSHIAVLDGLPLTSNGKVDRRALEAMSPGEQRAERARVAPRTPTEAAVAEIWESVLSTGAVGVHDDFFELGGQSFAALRVAALVAQRLGRVVPPGALLEQRTVAGLSTWLDTSTGDWSPLVRLREEADANPWFFVHPAGGDVMCYRGLAELLDGPFSAFQAPGPAVGRTPLATIEGFADLYLPALLEAQPKGPYRLGGWSSGAVIAFELARRLELRGETVSELVVIDAPAPVDPRALDETQVLLWFLEDLGIGLDLGRVEAGTMLELAAAPEADRLATALRLASEQAADGGNDRANAGTAADLAATLAVFRGVVQACNEYRGGRIAAPITVVRARDGRVEEFSGHPCAEAIDWGWPALTTGRVTGTVVAGTHHTLLTDQHVAAVADLIGRATTAARQEDH
jgi:amino acid adenylation domain-containing protein